jgi:hypothetical protein
MSGKKQARWHRDPDQKSSLGGCHVRRDSSGQSQGRIKEGAIPIISDVPGFRAYYVIYAPDDTVTAISIFDDHAGATESNRRGLAWIEQSLAPLLVGPATAVAGPVIVHTLA